VEGNVVAEFKILSRHLFGRTVENHENFDQDNQFPGRWEVITMALKEEGIGYSGKLLGARY
jgi:hypothetical protein